MAATRQDVAVSRLPGTTSLAATSVSDLFRCGTLVPPASRAARRPKGQSQRYLCTVASLSARGLLLGACLLCTQRTASCIPSYQVCLRLPEVPPRVHTESTGADAQRRTGKRRGVTDRASQSGVRRQGSAPSPAQRAQTAWHGGYSPTGPVSVDPDSIRGTLSVPLVSVVSGDIRGTFSVPLLSVGPDDIRGTLSVPLPATQSHHSVRNDPVFHPLRWRKGTSPDESRASETFEIRHSVLNIRYSQEGPGPVR